MLKSTHTWTANVPIPPEPPSTSTLYFTSTHSIQLYNEDTSPTYMLSVTGREMDIQTDRQMDG